MKKYIDDQETKKENKDRAMVKKQLGS